MRPGWPLSLRLLRSPEARFFLFSRPASEIRGTLVRLRDLHPEILTKRRTSSLLWALSAATCRNYLVGAVFMCLRSPAATLGVNFRFLMFSVLYSKHFPAFFLIVRCTVLRATFNVVAMSIWRIPASAMAEIACLTSIRFDILLVFLIHNIIVFPAADRGDLAGNFDTKFTQPFN